MAKILQIKTYPAKILRKIAQPIAEVAQEEKELFEDMVATMHNGEGVGLAAPQVGLSKRMIVADIGDGPVMLANPEVIEVKGRDRMEEGCLSLPGALVKVVRPNEATIKGLDENGETVEIKAKGLLARVLLHEIDHLNGKLILERMSLWQKIRFKLKQ